MNRIFWNLLLVWPFISAITVVTSAAAIAVEVPKATEAAQSQQAAVQPTTQAVAPSITSETPVVDVSTTDVTKAATNQQIGTTPLKESSQYIAQNAPSSNTVQQGTNKKTGLGQVTSVSQLSNVASKTTGLGQVTSVSQLSDVQPTDWAFQALQSLVERYGCIAGYPDGTYRGNRALTRYEFAAGLNACLDRVNELIQAATTSQVTREDLATLQRLQEEFSAELATLRGRVDALEAVTAEIESNQFSTTTKLNGEVVVAINDTFGDGLDDRGVEDNTVAQGRVRLNFDTSFTGRDQLRTRLQAGNFDALNFIGDVTNEGQLAYATDTDGEFVLNDLFYNFPIGDRVNVWLLVNSGEYDDFLTLVDTLVTATGTGAISNFSFNPIYNAGGQNAGLAADFLFTDALKLSLGYQGGENSDPSSGNGVFNGDNSFMARLEYGTERFQFAVGYLHTYDDGAVNSSEQGSVRSLVSVLDEAGDSRPVVGNHYGVEVAFALTPRLRISGWAGYSNATVLGLGDADVWNYAVTLTLPDFGKEGNLLGFIVGQEPKLTGTSGFTVPDAEGNERRSDPDTGLHVEAFYRYQITDNLSITPGVIWLTAPDHNNNNDDIIVGTIRTTFQF